MTPAPTVKGVASSTDYIKTTRRYAPLVEVAFGGDVDLLGPGHTWAFTTGVSHGVFAGLANDLVAPANSATTRTVRAYVVPADHFNYPRDPQFREELHAQVDWLTSI